MTEGNEVITLIYTRARPKVLGGYPGTVTDTLWA